MTVLEAVTETGARYRFDGHMWLKVSRDGYRASGPDTLWRLMTGTVKEFPWNAPDAWEDASEPEVGKHLFAAARDYWYVSTPVVEIREVGSLRAGLTDDN